jgi:hypothetical protein
MDQMPSTIAFQGDNLFIDRLLNPSRYFGRPEDILRDGTLDLQEKRAILASWASDACAVESMPALRQPPGISQPVSFDAIMDALRHLDAAGGEMLANEREGDWSQEAFGHLQLR